MNKRLLLLVVSVVGLAALLLPTLNATDAPTPTTEQLIAQLGSNSFAERMRADEMLRARGPGALPELRKALKSPDAEVRRRVQELVADLEVVAALQPKLVTLKVNKQPLSAVLQEIEKQTGYKPQLADKDDDQLCDLDVKRVPFWEALERLAQAAGLGICTIPFEEGIWLKRRKGRSPFVVVNGPFRVELLRFHEDRDIDFTAPGAADEKGQRDHRLTLRVAVMAEPKFILLSADQIQVETAHDEDQKPLGHPVVAEKRKVIQIDLEEILQKDFQHEASALLQRSSTKAKLIRVLRCKFPLRVVVERKRTVITENVRAAAGMKVQVGRDTLDITLAKQEENGDFSLSIRVPPKEPGVRWLWLQRVSLEDAKGNTFKSNSRGTSISGEEHVISLGYGKTQDPKVGPPTRLVIENWITLQHAIPFEFKDVPLP